ncbi:MAG: efflux RND transporter periplasmic adaptor subunit [Bacteriovoracaceae bacterium]|nr:efflux RND transporter periplasmic adaptor subunit [Bacteriovoracaceae bacterium]
MKLSCILIVLVFLSNYSILAAAPKNGKKIKSVFVKKVVLQEIFDTYSYPAKVIPKVNAAVLSESQGVIAKLHVGLGEKVVKNSKLASVRHTDPIYKYKPVNIKSPVDGVVSSIIITEGSLVSKGERLMTVTDPMKYSIRMEVTALDLKYIKKNLAGEFSVKGMNKKIKIKVKGVSPFVDPGTGTATAELSVDNSDDGKDILIGSLGQAVFKSNVHKGFVINEDAIYYDGKFPFLKIVENEKIRKIPVKLGKGRRGKVEITEGLKDGYIVVVRSSGYLADGEKVKIESNKKTKQNKM